MLEYANKCDEYILNQTFGPERAVFYNETSRFNESLRFNDASDACKQFKEYYKSSKVDPNKPKLKRCRDCKKSEKNCLCVNTFPDENNEYMITEDAYTKEKF